eukprot:TRINITY_DN16956_c0_g1_i1.p1 TRINITY_DN16956_c0_g1~~TRINITY_DN16956_c0_g1_i1.p1  ORF type:complete len:384 (+),score=29.31 TRINITY_DN16956_c0_g1_i1:120-1271(+)
MEEVTLHGSSCVTPYTLLRRLVSKQKCRHKEGKFDLDLTYVTPSLIAMGYPSEGWEASYRNPRWAVREFLDAKHGEHYRVYNLCSERCYPEAWFKGNACTYGWKDHQAPPFHLLVHCIEDMAQWCALSSRNTCAVHCKAGKGRTGVVACCYLLRSGQCSDAETSMVYYGERRSKKRRGVTIPSQRRYVEYYAAALRAGRLQSLPWRQLQLVSLSITPAPRSKQRLVLIVRMMLGESAEPQPVCRLFNYDYSGTSLVFRFGAGITVSDDVDFSLAVPGKPKPLFHFWINCAFVDPTGVTLSKPEIDSAHKDKKNSKFPHYMQVHLAVTEVPGSESAIPLIGEGWADHGEPHGPHEAPDVLHEMHNDGNDLEFSDLASMDAYPPA